MRTLSYTLVADGSSDVCLMPIIEWVVRQYRPDIDPIGQFASSLGAVGSTLEQRLPRALSMFPCDILFVHRDAEMARPLDRRREIESAVVSRHDHWVAIVPSRMTEAWLLSDESAIRKAAGNGSGRVNLNLPPKNRWESLPDPKSVLFVALRAATEKSGRALAKFNPEQARALIPHRTLDFSNLRGLSSFDDFETQTIAILNNYL